VLYINDDIKYIDNKKVNEIYFLQNFVYLGGEIRITRQSH